MHGVRSKLHELNAIIDELKHPFDPKVFPMLQEIAVSDFRPPAKGKQTSVTSLPSMLPSGFHIFFGKSTMIKRS